MIRKALLTASAAMLAVLGVSTSAHASTIPSLCGNSGTGYCLNDWNNSRSGPVKMYYGGTQNDWVALAPINRCEGGFTVTAVSRNDSINCPFSNVTLDQDYWGDIIYQIELNSGACAGIDSASGGVIATGCNTTSTGTGGGTGSVWIYDGASCSGDVFVNRYESDLNSQSESLESGGNPGVQAFVQHSNPTCWLLVNS